MAIEKLTEFAKTGQKDTDQLDLEVGFVVNRKPARQWFNWLFNALTNKINEIIDADFMPKSDVVDNLTTNDATKPVSAKQAKLLQDNKLDKSGGTVTGTLEVNGPLRSRQYIDLGYGESSDANRAIVFYSAGTSKKGQIASTTSGAMEFTGAASYNFDKTVSANISGNAATATKLATARTIGGVSFDGSANINLPGVNTTGNQDTSGNAASATNCSRSIVAGNGLSGGGELNANRTITLGKPGTVTATTGNTVSTSSHTHNLDVNSLPLLGYGQSWVDVKSSRKSGTTYTNSTSKPIYVWISIYDTNGSGFSVKINGVTIISSDWDLPANGYYPFNFIVPAGHTYLVNWAGGNSQLLSWAELR